MEVETPPPGPPPLLDEHQLHGLCNDGFVDVVLPEHLKRGYEQVFASAANFFALDEAAKRAAFPSLPKSTEHGYTSVVDEKEYLSLRYTTTTSSAYTVSRDFEEQIAGLWQETAGYLLRAMVDVSHYLHLDPWVWEPLIEACLAMPKAEQGATPTLFRVFRYEPGSGVADPHCDLGLLTLCVGSGKGLQLRKPASDLVPDGNKEQSTSDERDKASADTTDWRDAGECTLVVGDTLRALSGRRVRSGLHRVVGNADGRYSAIFALRTDVRQTIDLNYFGMPGSITSGELWNKIKAGRINVNAQRQVRDQQREARKSSARTEATGST